MARKRSTHRRNRGRLGPFLRGLSLLLTAVVIVAALTLFFKVGQMEVSGNSRYTAEEILAVTGVQEGDNLILLDRYHIAQRLYVQLPYITQVQIEVKLPDMLMVEVTETKVAAAIQGGGSWWLISASGKLLESVDSSVAQKYLCIENTQAQNPSAGGRLELEEKSTIRTQQLLDLMGGLEKRGMLAHTDWINVSDSEILVLGYDERFEVEIYYDADMEFKLNCLMATVSELEQNEEGTIRMTMENDNEVRFIPFE